MNEHDKININSYDYFQLDLICTCLKKIIITIFLLSDLIINMKY